MEFITWRFKTNTFTT